MIFDLTAANSGGRKYLFNDGKFAEETGGIEYDTSFASVTTDKNGIKIVKKQNSNGAYWCTVRFKNKLNFSKYKKLYFLFDFVDTKVSGGIYITSNYAVGQYPIRDVASESFSENAESFIVEIDVSTITDEYYVVFDMLLSNYASEEALGKGYRIRSIWYK